MSLINSFCVSLFGTMILLIYSGGVNAKVLELEESQLHGQKDQPESITFISRSQLDLSIKPIKPNFREEIVEATKNNKIFDLVIAE